MLSSALRRVVLRRIQIGGQTGKRRGFCGDGMLRGLQWWLGRVSFLFFCCFREAGVRLTWHRTLRGVQAECQPVDNIIVLSQ